MKTAIEIGFFVIPIVVSIAGFVFVRRVVKQPKIWPWALALSASVAFLVGYWLLPDWASMVPKRHWHWLPYLGVLAAIVGPLGSSPHNTIPIAQRWSVHLLLLSLAFLAAWLLVPTWSRLQPVRFVYIPSLAMYLFMVIACLRPLASRVPSRLLLAQLALSALALAAVVAAFVSLRYGYLAGVAAASVFGCWLASLISDIERSTAQSLIPVFVILMGGIAFVGYIELEPPLTALLLVPAAPLALWICQIGRLARLQGTPAAVAQTLVVLAGLTCAVSMIARRQTGDM